MLRHIWWAELQATYCYRRWVQNISRAYFSLFKEAVTGHRGWLIFTGETFTGETHANMDAGVAWLLCQQQRWAHTLEGAKEGQRAFTGMWRRAAATEPTQVGCATPQGPAWCHMTSSNMTNHQKTWSKSAQLNTSHLDTAGGTWPEQRNCGGCHQRWCPPLQTHSSVSAWEPGWADQGTGSALHQPTLQTPERCWVPPPTKVRAAPSPALPAPQITAHDTTIPSRLISKETRVNRHWVETSPWNVNRKA